jgi:hypothetical protein
MGLNCWSLSDINGIKTYPFTFQQESQMLIKLLGQSMIHIIAEIGYNKSHGSTKKRLVISSWILGLDRIEEVTFDLAFTK